MFVSKIMNNDVETMAGSFYFHDHRFAVIKVNIESTFRALICLLLIFEIAFVQSFSLLKIARNLYLL